MKYSSEAHLSIFERETLEETIENIFRKNVWKYRCKTIRAGVRLECEIFPIWNTKAQVRAAKAHKSRKAQQKLNHWNRQKAIARVINENFGRRGYWGTLTYDEAHLPKDDEQARRDIVNYLRRVKRKAKKRGIELKYIYVTGGERYHHHVIISGGIDRTELEEMWDGGGRTQMRRLQPGKDGLTGLAMYISKDKNMRMRWGHSQNLKKPEPTVADNKISKRRAEALAGCEDEARQFFEMEFPGYEFGRIRPKYSNYVSGVYLYVEMWKREEREMDEVREWLERHEQIILLDGEEYITRHGFLQMFNCSESQVRVWKAQGLPRREHLRNGRWCHIYPIKRCQRWFAGEVV